MAKNIDRYFCKGRKEVGIGEGHSEFFCLATGKILMQKLNENKTFVIIRHFQEIIKSTMNHFTFFNNAIVAVFLQLSYSFLNLNLKLSQI